MVLLTGMSGVGKSTVLRGLGARGFAVVDTDVGGWITDGAERLWRADRMDALIAEHEASGEPLFLAGTVRNQGEFYPRFLAVVLLTAPVEVMLDRIAGRTDNPFGKTAAERERVIADTAAVVPLLRASATVEIDTRRPVADVVDQIAALVERTEPERRS